MLLELLTMLLELLDSVCLVDIITKLFCSPFE